MFGKTVLGIDGELFESELDEAKKHAKGSRATSTSTRTTSATWSAIYKAIVKDHAGRDFPQDPREQLDMAVNAVFDSWNSERAVLYRRRERIPSDLGTAVNVMAMVFGNVGMDSGTGVAFTRDPASGEQGVYGDYLQNAQGEDVVAGIRNTVPLAELEKLDKKSYDELMAIMTTLEEHYRDLCDIEFTVEHGKLWMLQTRVGKRTAEAAFRIATQLVDQGLIDMDEAVRRVTGDQLAQLMFPRFDAERRQAADRHRHERLARCGRRQGGVRLDHGRRVERARREGDPGPPGDQPRRPQRHDRREGILTSRGGKTSHAAVVARGMGKTCVCGAEDAGRRRQTQEVHRRDGHAINEGDVISIDGSTGEVYLGEVPVDDSPVVRYFEGETPPPTRTSSSSAVHRIMQHADETRRLRVRTNADTPEDAVRARRFGAQGIGLCRTEHMFLGERRQLVETLILAENEDERRTRSRRCCPSRGRTSSRSSRRWTGCRRRSG